jgi:TorA maturation chaperone TorD
MYYLVFKEIEAIVAKNMDAATAALESQETFMNSFLRPWADKFANKMAEGAETDFYKALAGCLSAFVYKTDIQDSLSKKLKAAAVL